MFFLVAAIRHALDDAVFTHKLIMSHSANHRSNFYYIIIDEAKSAPKIAVMKTSQVPYPRAKEAMKEIE